MNALAERLLDEGVRRERHPLIFFRQGAAGRRPALVGTRLDVDKVIDTVRNSDGSAEEAAEYFEIPEHWVRACLRYYAEFRDEVDAWARAQQEFADREYALWLAERSSLA